MTVQTSYARLLRNAGMGDAVYYPTPEIKIGDVAYFTGVTYHRFFNVFELSRERAQELNIPMLRSRNGDGTRQPYLVETFKSQQTSVMALALEAGGNAIPGVVDFDVKIKAVENTEELAVCIPSDPLEICAFREDDSDLRLRKWWNEWRHNIAWNLGIHRHVGPLFMVFEKTDTEQYANCYYKGKITETNLKISGKVSDAMQLSMQAGFRLRESGSFGFKTSVYIPGKKWVIFIRSEKLYIIWFSKLKMLAGRLWHGMCQKRQPNKRPNWIDPTAPSSAAGLSDNSNNAAKGVSNGHVTSAPIETLSLSPNWTFIKTRDDFYAEYHGSSGPEQLESGVDAEEFALRTMGSFLPTTMNGSVYMLSCSKELDEATRSLTEGFSGHTSAHKVGCAASAA